MIIWLASYPRSGNTLLRTVLKQCFGLSSYSQYPAGPELDARVLEAIGHRDSPTPWPRFYRQASRSAERFLVKTHSPPRDHQPVLYLVRDGRAAIQSYRRYHAAYTAGHDPSLAALILGDDVYGDWTTHYRRWSRRAGGRRLALSFEELVRPGRDLLHQIGELIGHRGPIEDFHNPFAGLQGSAPEFFRRGELGFRADPDWDLTIDWLFHQVHGELMGELGFASPAAGPPAAGPPAADVMARLMPEISRLLAQRALPPEELEADRAAQVENLRKAERWLQDCEKDRADKQELIETLSARLAEVEADRVARLEASRKLGRQLEEVEADRAARQELIESLSARLEEVEADRADRLEANRKLGHHLEEVEADRTARQELIETLSARLAEVEADRAARLELIESLSARLAEVEADRAARLAVIERLKARG